VTAYEEGADGLPAGVSVGHWTDLAGRTGCSVILVPGGAVGGVDVRGGAPGTLGTEALRPGRAVSRVQAILLTGGSAFGLDAATGVMRYLDERGLGFAIGPVSVPIVAGAVIFDLLAGDPQARPRTPPRARSARAPARRSPRRAPVSRVPAGSASPAPGRTARPWPPW